MNSMDSRDTTPPPFRPTPEGRRICASLVTPGYILRNRIRVQRMLATGVVEWPR